jgi:hypothetical protein
MNYAHRNPKLTPHERIKRTEMRREIAMGLTIGLVLVVSAYAAWALVAIKIVAVGE